MLPQLVAALANFPSVALVLAPRAQKDTLVATQGRPRSNAPVEPTQLPAQLPALSVQLEASVLTLPAPLRTSVRRGLTIRMARSPVWRLSASSAHQATSALAILWLQRPVILAIIRSVRVPERAQSAPLAVHAPLLIKHRSPVRLATILRLDRPLAQRLIQLVTAHVPSAISPTLTLTTVTNAQSASNAQKFSPSLAPVSRATTLTPSTHAIARSVPLAPSAQPPSKQLPVILDTTRWLAVLTAIRSPPV